MKNVIAVSACLKRCSVAVSYEGSLYAVNENVDAAENLVWLADNLIKSENIDLKKLEGIITTSGPGSFTGIRVAQSFAKGLALALRLPAICINYFDVLENMYSGNYRNNIFAVIKNDENTICCRIRGEYRFVSPEVLAESLKNPVVLIGDAIAEVSPYMKGKIIEAVYRTDFRKAEYLLNFMHRIREGGSVRPLYVSGLR
ncbi:MAG: tRNA (adenosine(37)-N6)-threonylcarbamoyltransferase complex dimerization subunit type 1 TsaB [Holosporaceae bacterium]|jgi:tRNA threonylcarbamoyl adenosine modification protein YeaZ|nr:tRNA (adenosine(37)-N6)-threonylcarbamoyltransferase complex dimerization subunit type 1 TsaB [Holosporaceae bacterium]